MEYKSCYPAGSCTSDMIQAVQGCVRNHLWYLTRELVIFWLFDDALPQEERQAMAEKLLNLAPLPYEPHDWNSLVRFLCRNKKLVDISQASGRRRLVGTNCCWMGQQQWIHEIKTMYRWYESRKWPGWNILHVVTDHNITKTFYMSLLITISRRHSTCRYWSQYHEDILHVVTVHNITKTF